MNPPPAIICENSTRSYLERVAEFYGSGRDVFLFNPLWTPDFRENAEALVQNFAAAGNVPAGRIFVASGGSGGKLRFVAHTPKTLEASARALGKMLALPGNAALNCFACLPPWHISGLMPFVRSRVSGGTLFVVENGGFRSADDLPDFRENRDGFWMNSLVPTQFRRILALDGGAAWLRKFDFILLGGAPVPADLIERAAGENLKIGIGYGMTETASLVALWRIGDTDEIAGTLLPHARIALEKNTSRIRITAESLGETLAENGVLLPNPGSAFLTNDEGAFDADGRLKILGRADRYIISGGEKIDPHLVEQALVRLGIFAALVVGEPDAEWGQRVTALAVPPIPRDWKARLRQTLPAWMLPKRLIVVSALPLDAKGKLDRVALVEALNSGKS